MNIWHRWSCVAVMLVAFSACGGGSASDIASGEDMRPTQPGRAADATDAGAVPDSTAANARETVAAATSPSGRLPGTASPLPTAAIIGVVSLVAAAGVRLFRRRR